MSRDTRNRILVSSLLLFNEKGERNTTTNEIADAVDISPGNLHYHFRRKANLVEALLLEFQADARKVLQAPQPHGASLDDFWIFLHHLLELTAAYRFLFRDMESLLVEFPKIRTALQHFARALVGSFELNLQAVADSGVIRLGNGDARLLSRNLAVIALFSAKLDELTESARGLDDSALRTAGLALNVLKPFVSENSAAQLTELAAYYKV